MNRRIGGKQVLGISFPRAESQPIGDFVKLLRDRGHFVSQTKVAVSVWAMPGSLEEMTRSLHELAREFDRVHGALVANSLCHVWEFRECCVHDACWAEDPIWADMFAAGDWIPTGKWKEIEPLDGHRRIVQTFVLSETVSDES